MTPDMTSALARAEARLADALQDPARICSLSNEMAAAVVGELRALWASDQQLTDDVVKLTAENERLRARDEAAEAVVRWWRTRNFSAPPPEGARLLDALARAHADEDGGRVSDERAYVSRLWAEDWNSPEDSVYDEPAPIDWPARLGRAADVAWSRGREALARHLEAVCGAATQLPADEVEAIGRALLGEEA
jgi:hypothetical protein